MNVDVAFDTRGQSKHWLFRKRTLENGFSVEDFIPGPKLFTDMIFIPYQLLFPPFPCSSIMNKIISWA